MVDRDQAQAAVLRMYKAALTAADPRRAVRESLRLDHSTLMVGGEQFNIGGCVIVIALGKAAVTMSLGAQDALGEVIAAGIAITKDGHRGDARFDRIEIAEAAHPIPDERGVAATKRALDLVRETGRDDLVLALISGGGSALFEAPRSPVTLADMAAVTNLLLRAGASIGELNRVRTPLSLVKGGGLLEAAGVTPVVTLILSDVLGNDPRVIASGPTVPGGSDRAEARAVLERFGLWERVPASVRCVLEDQRPAPMASNRGVVSVIADNNQAVEAAAHAARDAGMQPAILWREATGEARVRARDWAAACLDAPDDVDCLLGGGEMTVTVTGNGIGGRNTEFALSAAQKLHELDRNDWLIASLATDGQDGPTDVAGAILSAEDIELIEQLGHDPGTALTENDSLAPIVAIGGAVAPGPTGTNVNDLYVAVRITRGSPR